MSIIPNIELIINKKLKISPAYGVIGSNCMCSDYCPIPGKHHYLQENKDFIINEINLAIEYFEGKILNYLIPTGRINNILVLDIDRRENGFENFIKLKNRFPEITNTFSVNSGGSGLHFYYRTNKVIQTKADQFISGIDVLSQGGWVIGPGSKHVSSNFYTTVDEKQNINPLPKTLEQIILKAENGESHDLIN